MVLGSGGSCDCFEVLGGVLMGGQAGVMKNSGWFLNTFLMESWLNPLRGLPFGHLCWFDSWDA